MPDPIQSPGQGASGQPASGANGNPAGQEQIQEPAWLSKLTDENERKEAREGWLRDADYRKKTMEISERQKAWGTEKQQLEARTKELENFYRDQYEPFRQNLERHWDKIAPILSGQQQPQPHPVQQPDGSVQMQYDTAALSLMDQNGWDRLGQTYQARYVGPLVQQVQQVLAQQFNQELARREQVYQNYLKIMNDAYARKFQDPTLDIPKFMEQALAVQSGKINPLDVAYNTMTYEDRLKAAEEAAFKRGQEEKELQYKNNQIANGAMQNPLIPVFKQKPLTRDQVTEVARQAAVKQNQPW